MTQANQPPAGPPQPPGAPAAQPATPAPPQVQQPQAAATSTAQGGQQQQPRAVPPRPTGTPPAGATTGQAAQPQPAAAATATASTGDDVMKKFFGFAAIILAIGVVGWTFIYYRPNAPTRQTYNPPPGNTQQYKGGGGGQKPLAGRGQKTYGGQKPPSATQQAGWVDSPRETGKRWVRRARPTDTGIGCAGHAGQFIQIGTTLYRCY